MANHEPRSRPRGSPPRARGRRRTAAAGVFVAIAMLVPLGCEKKVEPAPTSAPTPTFSGPPFLRGTIGSLVRMRRDSAEPMLVSNYGLVVLPKGSGTGSSQVPPFLRSWLINEMRKRGLGSARLNTQALSPERVLADRDTAVVTVHGFIPPGAVRGTRFDVLVRAVPQTETTSLTGGLLWTAELSPGGTNTARRFTFPLATAYGPMYISPDRDMAIDRPDYEHETTGIIVGGGKATEARPIELVLNQPSWVRSRLIGDRINERFGRTTDPRPIAEPQTDLLIRLNIPDRYANRPEELIDLISHTYLDRGPNFEAQQAVRLADQLRRSPQHEGEVVLAWRALGRTVVPQLRPLYEDESMTVRLAALEAGAWLEDERASRYLDQIASMDDPELRRRAAEALVYLPDSTTGTRVLKRLLDDEDRSVRIAAYESLAENGDPLIDRWAVGELHGPKFYIDRVPAERPLIYITPDGTPRLVVFSEQLPFEGRVLARLWDNHLMIEGNADDGYLNVFYQGPGRLEGRTLRIAPTVATLAFALAHHPTASQPQDGFDLSYGETVNAIYHLCERGVIPAPVEVRRSALMELIEGRQEQLPTPTRPETAPPSPDLTDDVSGRDTALRSESEDAMPDGSARRRPESGLP